MGATEAGGRKARPTAEEAEARGGLPADCVQIKKPRGRGASRLPGECLSYAWKDFPQPHPPVALGFSTEKPAPRKSST